MWVRVCPHVILLLLANIFKASCEGTSSLTFVIDDTGSMSDDIDQVKSSVNKIMDIAFKEKSSVIKNMVLVTFNEPVPSNIHVRADTTNRDIFKSRLNAVEAHNIIDHDCFEPSMNGLLQALQTSLPGSYIYAFTDAPSKDHMLSYQVKEMCQRKQSQIVFVLTGRCFVNYEHPAFKVYFDIAAACSGLAYEVPKNEVNQVIRTIEETIKGNKTVIATTTVPPGVYSHIPFTIDEQTDYAIVSATGLHVSLDVKGPHTRNEWIMWNDNGKVLKLSDAVPGQYIATVMGHTITTVVIVGRTDFFFSHGFSKLEPKTLGDTSPQPIAGAKVHLSVSITDPKHEIKIESAQILRMDQKTVIEDLPLRQLSSDFYTTKLFVAPSLTFKVAVKGTVKATGKPITRIAKIPVTVSHPPPMFQNKKKPTAQIVEGKSLEVEYGSTVKLTCKVSAFPRPRITWINRKGATMKSSDSLVQYPFEYISYMTISNVLQEDKYRCYTANEEGNDSKTINLKVKDPLVVKTIPAGTTMVMYGSEGTIKCDIRSPLPMHILWYYANEMTGVKRQIVTSDKYWISSDGTQLKVTKMDLDFVGKYTCKAYLLNNKDVQKTYSTRVKIDGLINPKVMGPSKKKVTKGTTAVLECKIVNGLPKPKITWQFMDKSGSKFTPIAGSENVLRILNVEDKHAGRYKCIAENAAGKDDHVTTLIIQELPKITSRLSTVYQGIEGDALLRIPCVSTGLPKPVITWKLNGRAITPSAKYSTEDEALIIRSPKVSDTNSYTCESTNALGSVSVTFQTHILQIPKLSGLLTKKVRIGTTASIECMVIEGEPKPKITWQFMDNSGSTFVPIAGSDNVLHITSVENKHAGRYKCVAQNDVGSDNHETTLIVESAPKVMGPNDKKVTKGTTAVVECNIVNGLPKPKITWQFMDKSDSKFTPIAGSENVLRILNVEDKHAGRYKCIAENIIGKDEHVTTLIIQELPTITSRLSTVYQGIEGDALLRIPCVSTGLPKPVITWKLNGRAITPSAKYSTEDEALIIRSPKVSDTNSYTCEATNAVGSVSATFQTHILQIPKLSGLLTKKVMIGTTASIECMVNKGEPKPKMTWQFMDNTGSTFVPIDGSDNVLHITSAENKHAGRYKCVAQNDVGSDDHETTLIVESPPVITNSLAVVEGLEGDIALRIPCDVVGVPPPVITWKLNGAAITPSAKYFIENGALVIMNPNEKDSNTSYVCEAKNYIGSVSATFKANVEKVLNGYGVKHYVYLLEGETRKLDCEAFKSKSQSVKWIINGVNITVNTPYVEVAGATVLNDGNYTCRVSDKHGHTHTHTYVVDVGRPPILGEETPVDDWRGDINDILANCETLNQAKPSADVEWKFNGEVLTDQNVTELGIYYQWGHYSCNVSNVHGSVQKSFDVKSSTCLISRNFRDAQHMPLLLTDDLTWPKWETTKHYSVVEPEEKITLYCPSKGTPNAFQKFPKQNELKAYCNKQDLFSVDGTFYKISDLHCSHSIEPTIVRKKVKCLTDTSELIRVGYNVAGFLETYEVCFDHAKNMPLYTRVLMTKTDKSLNAAHSWYKYPGIGDGKLDKRFTCEKSLSSRCYSKSQLVNARDFKDDPAKYSTYIDSLNAIPLWRASSTVNQTTWEDVDEMVRGRITIYDEFIAWSGTHTLQEKDGAVIPRFLWKVLRFDEDASIAIVHVNGPSLTDKDIKCKESYRPDWFKPIGNYTYCCELSEFLEAFDLQGTNIGESLDEALKKIEDST